jgi:hypothetical protein
MNYECGNPEANTTKRYWAVTPVGVNYKTLLKSHTCYPARLVFPAIVSLLGPKRLLA